MNFAEFSKEYLHNDLIEIREIMLGKLDGLSEYDIRRPLTVTGTNLLGLIKHLTLSESRYFGLSCASNWTARPAIRPTATPHSGPAATPRSNKPPVTRAGNGWPVVQLDPIVTVGEFFGPAQPCGAGGVSLGVKTNSQRVKIGD